MSENGSHSAPRMLPHGMIGKGSLRFLVLRKFHVQLHQEALDQALLPICAQYGIVRAIYQENPSQGAPLRRDHAEIAHADRVEYIQADDDSWSSVVRRELAEADLALFDLTLGEFASAPGEVLERAMANVLTEMVFALEGLPLDRVLFVADTRETIALWEPHVSPELRQRLSATPTYDNLDGSFSRQLDAAIADAVGFDESSDVEFTTTPAVIGCPVGLGISALLLCLGVGEGWFERTLLFVSVWFGTTLLVYYSRDLASGGSVRTLARLSGATVGAGAAYGLTAWLAPEMSLGWRSLCLFGGVWSVIWIEPFFGKGSAGGPRVRYPLASLPDVGPLPEDRERGYRRYRGPQSPFELRYPFGWTLLEQLTTEGKGLMTRDMVFHVEFGHELGHAVAWARRNPRHQSPRERLDFHLRTPGQRLDEELGGVLSEGPGSVTAVIRSRPMVGPQKAHRKLAYADNRAVVHVLVRGDAHLFLILFAPIANWSRPELRDALEVFFADFDAPSAAAAARHLCEN